MKNNSIGSFTTTASWIRRLSLSILLLGYLSNPAWGKIQQAEITERPKVEGEEVTIRVKVKDHTERPVIDLEETDFQVSVDDREVPFLPKDWKSPQEAEPPPAWIVVLLDMSGSMRNPDSQGKTKFTGAINAIREFIKVSSQKGGDTRISIVPFGDKDRGCPPSFQGYAINEGTLNQFFAAGDDQLKNNLNSLAAQTSSLCAKTNLYQPLNEAVRFLGDRQNPNFYPQEDSQPQPRLAIILLSDGYDNSGREGQAFAEYQSRIKRHPEITVHTLGYGLTPEELGKKYRLGRAVTRGDLNPSDPDLAKRLQEGFVDKKRLAEIASLTGGIAEFGGDARDIARALQLFLVSVLGEYEITYTEPNPERGKKHSVQVTVNSGTETVQSPPRDYRMKFFAKIAPLPLRLLLLLLSLLALGIGGALPFYYWGKTLKNQNN